jgi:kynurenine formamidase
VPVVNPIWEVDKGDKATMLAFQFISHTGTYVDDPSFFISGDWCILNNALYQI